MARITKDPAERKNELITIAEQLFLEKGYDRTTVWDGLTLSWTHSR